MNIQVPVFKCKKCGYEWTPRIPRPGISTVKMPGTCPKYECRSPNWNRDRK